jgi:hypothetical protein
MNGARKDDGRLIGGIILIVLGVLLLLDRFRVIDFDFGWLVSRYWPSVLILMGVLMLTRRERGERQGAFWLIGIGAILQVQRLELFWWWRWRNLWPVLLILVGVWLLVDRMRTQPATPIMPQAPPDPSAPQPPGLPR